MGGPTPDRVEEVLREKELLFSTFIYNAKENKLIIWLYNIPPDDIVESLEEILDCEVEVRQL